MNLDRLALVTALAMAEKVTPRNATLPILRDLRLQTTTDQVRLHATDLEMELVLTVPYDGPPAPGADLCLTAAPLLKLLKTLKTPRVELDWCVKDVEGVEGSREVSVEVDGTRVAFPAYAATDFPTSTDVSRFRPLTLPGLFQALAFCLPFSSTDSSRYTLNAIKLGPEGKVASTDGHRLAVTALDATPEALIPSLLVATLLSGPFKTSRVLDQLDVVTDNATPPRPALVAFPLKQGWIMARQVDGTFPNIEQVIPRTASSIITVNREALLAQLERVIAVSTDDRKRAPMTLLTQEDGVVLRSDETQASFPVPTAVATAPTYVGLNSRYLKTALEALEDQTVSLRINGPLEPVRIENGQQRTKTRPATWQPQERLIVTMPMRTQYVAVRQEEEKKRAAADKEVAATA